MTVRVRRTLFAACAMLSLAGSAQAAYHPQSGADEAAAREAFKPDRSLEEVSRSYCATGMQRFVPGSYYYCVGRRELARGHHERSTAALIEAARWGSKQAQFLLGVGYFKGDNPAQDRARGLAWLGLAAERGDVVYLGVLKSAMAQATDEEKARAGQLYLELLGSYGDDVAAVRAERRYRREREQLMRGDVYGAEICIDGLNATRPPAARADAPDQNVCPSRLPVALVARQVDDSAEEVLRGWAGHVTVGELHNAPLPGR